MSKGDRDRVVVVGGGGREHALVWKLKQSPLVGNIFCLPGNPGIAEIATCVKEDLSDMPGLVQSIVMLKPALVVIGPDKPLVDGLADELELRDIPVFGPSKAAARLEGSKTFAKEAMRDAGVPTADFFATDDIGDAEHYIRSVSRPLVVKADGLCDGKGVIVCDTPGEALIAAKAMLVDGIHGESGRRIVIEDRLEGREMSIMAATDGEGTAIFEPSRDHKRLLDGDRGPNTGGMGVFAPVPGAHVRFLQHTRYSVLDPMISYLAKHGTPFRGLLYAGIMLTSRGPRVLEYNIRFGDPEAETVLPLMEDDLYPLLLGAALGHLPYTGLIPANGQASVTVILCADTYPGRGSKGVPITGIEAAADRPGVQIFHAGTALVDGELVTNGGRILAVNAIGDTHALARARAYTAARCIQFAGKSMRFDIAAGI